MRIGILGAGRIAGTLARTMAQIEEVECYAVASRSLEKAKDFADNYDFDVAYGSYEEMLGDEKVELVYIATPHSHHYEHMKMCIEHGKPVLCEKAFTMNAVQAKEIEALAREKKVYVAEAIWTRYMPSRKMIDDVLASGVIGKVTALTANLSYVIDHKERIVTPELAGGALLDVGVYCVNFALMHFGKDIERIETSVQMTETGVDGQETITVFYKDGKMANLTAGIYSRSDRRGIFYGNKGYVVVDNVNNPLKIEVFDMGDNLVQCHEVPEQISGYEYEVLESIQMVKEGSYQSESMPLAESVHMMEIMDGIRKQWNLVYPQEKSL